MQMQKQSQIYRGVFHTFTKIVKYETVSYIMGTDMAYLKCCLRVGGVGRCGWEGVVPEEERENW